MPLQWLETVSHSRLVRRSCQMKLITPSAVAERLKINGSLARRALKHLLKENLIRTVSYHSAQGIYTRATNVEAEA